MKLNLRYLAAFVILFIIELFIALFVKDNFIRPYIGDVLVVILLYVFVKAFIKYKIKFLPIYIFLIAVFVEVLQYFKIVELLGVQDNKILRTIIGTSFDIKDIGCYFIGCIFLILFEKILKTKNKGII